MKTNIFKLGPHIVLPEDKVQLQHAATAEEEEEMQSEIQQLENRIKSVSAWNEKCSFLFYFLI